MCGLSALGQQRIQGGLLVIWKRRAVKRVGNQPERRKGKQRFDKKHNVCL